MRVGTRLAGGFLALIALFAAALLYNQTVVEDAVTAGQELASVDSRVLLATSAQLDEIAELRENAAKLRITADRGYYDAYRANRLAIADTIGVVRALGLGEGAREAADRMHERWLDFMDRFVPPTAESEISALASTSEARLAGFETALDGLSADTRALRRAARNAVTSTIRQTSRDAERAVVTGWTALALAIGLAAAIAVAIVRSITRPLARIGAGARAIAGGDFDVRVEAGGRDELAALAVRFNDMATRLGELDQIKRDFLAKVSHDLKTPLASIQETSRLLLDRIPGELNAKQARLLELGLANAERLSAMISKLLELSRLEAGVVEYRFEPVDLRRLGEETAERLTAGDVPLEVRLIGEGPVEVAADRDALERVLENLLENARHHAGGESVDIIVERTGDASRPLGAVRVRDRGPGVPEEERERIFEGFSGRRGVYDGGHAGLGLAICREIVTAHGGRVTLEDAPGGGSVFGFEIPVSRNPGSSPDGRSERDE